MNKKVLPQNKGTKFSLSLKQITRKHTSRLCTACFGGHLLMSVLVGDSLTEQISSDDNEMSMASALGLCVPSQVFIGGPGQ